MSVATKSSRWPSHRIPFEYSANITDEMKEEIKDAMRNWQENTQVRFHKKKSSDDAFITFLRDDEREGCGSSGVGYTGGEITIRLKESCDVKTVIHEIAHALGIHHEQKRPDQLQFVSIKWENIIPDTIEQCISCNFTPLDNANCVTFGIYDFESIMHYSKSAFSDNGEDTIVPVDPSNEIRPSNVLTNGDIRLARRIIPSNVHLHRIGTQGTVGTELSRLNWTDGWTIARFFKINSIRYLFLLKTSDGTMQIHGFNEDRFVDEPIQKEEWSSGWSIAEFYTIDNTTFLFLLKKSDGTMHIYKIKSDGTIGVRVATENWASGWTSAKFYKIGSSNFIFLLKEDDGIVHIQKIRDDGNIGDRIVDYNWSQGWSNVELYEVNDTVFLFLLKSSTGAVHIHRMNTDGRVGQRLSTEDWSDGWTTSTFYKINNQTYVFLLKKSNGSVKIHRMDNNGTMGRQVATENWSAGWTSAEIIDNLLVLIKSNGPVYTI